MDIDWHILNVLIQYLVLPAVIMIWQHEKRLGGHDKEILKALTILDERNKRRDEDREEVASILRDLRTEIARLAERIEKLGSR